MIRSFATPRALAAASRKPRVVAMKSGSSSRNASWPLSVSISTKETGKLAAFSAWTIVRASDVGYSQSEVKETTQIRVFAPTKARARTCLTGRAEQRTHNPWVDGSNPSFSTTSQFCPEGRDRPTAGKGMTEFHPEQPAKLLDRCVKTVPFHSDWTTLAERVAGPNCTYEESHGKYKLSTGSRRFRMGHHPIR